MTRRPKQSARRPDSAREVNGIVGRALMEARESFGMTRSELEGACGLPRGAMRRIEDGIRSVSAGELFSLTGKLGLEPAQVFAGLPGPSSDSDQPDRTEVTRLVRSFSKIPDAAVRKKLLQMVRAAVENPENNP